MKARAWAVREFPLETYQSYPIPVDGGEGLAVVFLFGPQHAVAGEGAYLASPCVLMELNAASGDLKRMEKVTPQALGQTHSPNKHLGLDAMTPGMTADEFLAERDRLYDAYDVVLPSFARKQTKPTPELKLAANQFKSAIPVVLENVLMPYYLAVGREFFTWLDLIARG